MKIKLSLLFALLVLVQVTLWSQSPINSPYSRYGYGELSDPSFGAQKAMGGIGYGLREANIINPLNPASYSAVDSMTFMLDIAVSGQLSRYSDGDNKSRNINGKLDYVALQFPLYKHFGMGFGFKPVSYVGYKYGIADSAKIYSGSGGLNQVFGALSYKFKQLSIGVNAGYLFGNIYHTGQVTFGNGSFPTVTLDTMSISGLVLDLGVQYTHLFGKDQQLVIGAVYTPKLSTNANYSGGTFTYTSSNTISSYSPIAQAKTGQGMPEAYALGISYAKGRKFLLGVDYSYQKWSDVKFEGNNNVIKDMALNDRTKINFGGEFVPNARGRNYLGRMHYRLGGNYANSYISPVANGKESSQFDEYGVSCGFGLPLTGGRSTLNLAFEYLKVTPQKQIAGMIEEQYIKFTVSYTFNELWFFQRKVQ